MIPMPASSISVAATFSYSTVTVPTSCSLYEPSQSTCCPGNEGEVDNGGGGGNGGGTNGTCYICGSADVAMTKADSLLFGVGEDEEDPTCSEIQADLDASELACSFALGLYNSYIYLPSICGCEGAVAPDLPECSLCNGGSVIPGASDSCADTIELLKHFTNPEQCLCGAVFNATDMEEFQSSCCLRSPSGSNGDPHFRTWNGGHFEYHGQCDMILVKDDDFADGLGLQVQIRTKLVKFWSFIQNAAIRIGDDVLEMQGSPDLSVNKGNNHYWINSIYQGQVTTLGGFPVKANYAGKHKNKRWFFSKYGGGNKISRSFEIDLSSKYPGQKIVIGSYKEFVRVDFHNADADTFGNSVGMLGEFASGKTLARDGITELNDYTKLGHEWQVLPEEDGMLFHNVSYPQYPEKCIDPGARAMKRLRRRLGESSITDEQAEAACAPIEDALDRKDCIYDVLVTQDLTMVGAY
eukprot:scaffold279_cov90-Cylindrotheca_fusiformis.AAC.5